MIKAPIDLQDLRPRLYVKAKAEPPWRFTASRLQLAAVASPMAIPAISDSGSSMIGLINLEMKCAGTRSAGNRHAACEAAGAGNGITNIPSRARRGQPRIQTRDVLSGYRASSRPYQPLKKSSIIKDRCIRRRLYYPLSPLIGRFWTRLLIRWGRRQHVVVASRRTSPSAMGVTRKSASKSIK